MEHKKNSTHRVLFIVAGLFLPLFGIIFTDQQSASFMHNDSTNALGKTHFIVGCPLQNIPDTHNNTRTQSASSYEYDTIPLNQDGHVCSALFAPDDKWYETLLSLIERKRKEFVLPCIY